MTFKVGDVWACLDVEDKAILSLCRSVNHTTTDIPLLPFLEASEDNFCSGCMVRLEAAFALASKAKAEVA